MKQPKVSVGDKIRVLKCDGYEQYEGCIETVERINVMGGVRTENCYFNIT